MMIRWVFLISDLLFPLWWALIIYILIRKGISKWKSYAIATSIIMIQAYFVAKTIGWNLGAYFIGFIGLIPSFLFNEIGVSDSNILISEVYSFWVFPVIIILVFPTLILYFLSARNEKTTA